MKREIFAIIKHKKGIVDETVYELRSLADKIDFQAKNIALVMGTGEELGNICKEVSTIYHEVWKIDNPELSYPNSEIMIKLLAQILPEQCICLVTHDNTIGIDLGPTLSIKLNVPLLPDIIDLQAINVDSMQGDQIKNSLKSSNKLNYLQPSSGKILKAIREEFGGQVHVPLYCDMAKGAVITLRPGIFEAHEFRSSDPQIIDQSDKAKPVEDAKCRFLKILEAEVGDVDISMQDILVSVGRGIENEENINLAKKLAEYLGGAMSCSRPVVDTNWMEKHRQVGTSGKTVKPKIYIALGISGAFQHLAGIKGNPFIMAINKNPTAPIFKVSKVGIVGDINTYLQKIIDKFTDCPH